MKTNKFLCQSDNFPTKQIKYLLWAVYDFFGPIGFGVLSSKYTSSLRYTLCLSTFLFVNEKFLKKVVVFVTTIQIF
jgi:hypothetical protein